MLVYFAPPRYNFVAQTYMGTGFVLASFHLTFGRTVIPAGKEDIAIMVTSELALDLFVRHKITLGRSRDTV